ncbi:MAG: VOC family protein [Bacteroidota bacterium]|nr:VOC family protein [Bacteroidota bacterium]MDP4217015.1 VOC family protein [Bacteroidota bacterium]MDP4246197.1 VOC family protein [Bacteroidota bacterium]MDP4256435.1 VOC family protein [Bacteroidota bacterium]MDP4258627.1 VOC family protein [Bacteroidota bacterium]
MQKLNLSRAFTFMTILTAMAFIAATARAQAPHFNHTTIFVTDLKRAADFYQNVLQLKAIPEPFHDGKHVWVQIAEHSELHIVSGAKEDIPHDINIHLAFSVPDVEAFSKRLDEAHVKYGNWAGTTKAPQVRPDGVKQIYLQDPDGYWIEIDDDKF